MKIDLSAVIAIRRSLQHDILNMSYLLLTSMMKILAVA